MADHQLARQPGAGHDRRLISKAWIDASLRKHATSDLHGEDYGYLWRIIERRVGGATVRSCEAWGNGGQLIMVFPQLHQYVLPAVR